MFRGVNLPFAPGSNPSFARRYTYPMNVDFEESFRRIDAIIGDEDDPGKATEVWFHHLRANLALPCDVTGVEDFRWEEPYVLGVGDAREYRRLCRQQPSYLDVFT